MRHWLTILLLMAASGAWAQSFKVVPLGVKGGIDESNLSAYLLAPASSEDYICLDAGTIHAGLQRAVQQGVFTDPAETVLKNRLKAYLISHPHLDHLAGLVTNSTDDGQKPIYATDACLEVLKNHYFNWKSWPNMGDGGNSPTLNKYHYHVLAPGQETTLAPTSMTVKAFPLSHGNPYQSTAFLVRNGADYLLYLGDTGPDAVEQSTRLAQLWQAVAPLIRARALKAIFIEVSYPNEQPDKQLFGHLTPRWLLHELTALSQLTGRDALNGFPVIITHMKPTGTNEATIRQQLVEANSLNVKLVFPEQGKMLSF